jgi:hypothetical protein
VPNEPDTRPSMLVTGLYPNAKRMTEKSANDATIPSR